jgi:HlyD family secretion protein
MRSGRKVLLAAGSAAVVMLVVFVIGRRGPEAVDVDAAPVTRLATLRSHVTASGEIVATRYANIGSSAMGKIVELPVKEGDRVRAGQLLARIDAVQATSAAESAAAGAGALQAEASAAADQVRAAQADLAFAEARATETARALERARGLRAEGVTSAAEFDAAETAARTAEAQVGAARAAVARAQQARTAAERRVTAGRADTARARDQLAKTDITSPIDGVITRLQVEEGEMVVIGIQNQPGTTLMTVSDLSAIDAEIKVAEADVLRLSLGDPATVTLEALAGRAFPGRVVEIGASALPQIGAQAAAREFLVKVRLDGDVSALRPGLTCDAEVLVDERTSVLTVPLQAVVERPSPEGGAPVRGVFVVDDGTARFAEVKTGIIGGLAIELTGVAEGASVVVGPFQALRELTDGAAVKPRRVERR